MGRWTKRLSYISIPSTSEMMGRVMMLVLVLVLKMIWMEYVTDEVGLRTTVVREWFEDFGGPIDWDSLPDVVGSSTVTAAARIV